jgi:hypothetical protein
VPILIKTTGFDQYLHSGERGGSYIKALIMGDHGVGKTPSAACWPDAIIADCENGLASVASNAVPYADIRTTDDMLALIEHCRRDSLLPVDKRRYRTLVIDTIDSYQRRIIQQRLKAEQKESMSGWQDWGWLDGKMTQLIEGLLSLPMHVVVNMHVKDFDDGDDDTKMLVKKARLKGDFKDSIFQDFDLIGLMETSYVQGQGDKKGERVRVRNIRWHAEPRFPSLRDRFNKLPRFTTVDFTERDFWRIFEHITEGMDSIPETKTVDEAEGGSEPAVEPAEADAKGGPVESPQLPRNQAAKRAAKKVAKKAPAKKAVKGQHVELAEPVRHEDEKPVAEGGHTPQPKDPWTPPSTATDVAVEAIKGVQAEAVAEMDKAVGLLTEELGAEEVKTETEMREELAKAEKPKRTAKACGDQPDSMAARGFEAAPGCGRELSADNAGKAQIAVLKAKTYLCDDCFAAFTNN